MTTPASPHSSLWLDPGVPRSAPAECGKCGIPSEQNARFPAVRDLLSHPWVCAGRAGTDVEGLRWR